MSFVLLLAGLPLAGQARPAEIPHFKDISRSAGLDVSHISTAQKNYLPETMSGGVGFIDCANNDRLDILTVNGSTMARFRARGGDPMVTLYRQERHLKFKNITEAAGLTQKGWGMGVSVADYDNNGHQDFYVTGYGGSALYKNLGDCKFQDVTAQAGVNVRGFPTGAAWGDYDRDGFVDLFVPRYAHVDIQQEGLDDHRCMFWGLHVFCGPWGFPGETDYLFHNQGDGTFKEVSKKAGVQNSQGYYGMQGLWVNLENNGWPDLYVTNDRPGPNYLYHNNRNGTFKEVGMVAGVALGGNGDSRGSMGVDACDLFHDGRFDLFVTNFMQEPDTLYKNTGPEGFDDISIPSGIASVTLPYVGWGTGCVDFTNDGWDDIFIANGHIYPQIDQANQGEFYREPVLLFHNNRDGTFTDITKLAGLDKLPLESRRGVAFGDVDNDGKEDILILNEDGPPTLLLNCTQNSNHAVLLKLIGTKSNRAAIGAEANVIAGKLNQIQEVRSGGSYLSQNDLRLHFGLGRHAKADTIEINWPSGAKQTLRNVPADFIYTIKEGVGIIHRTHFAKTPPCTTKAQFR